MMTDDRIKAAADAAAALFDNGFHCAEAVSWSVLNVLGENPDLAAAHATAFGGGFGRSFDEACGALSGGLIAIGHLHGRRAPGGDWDLPASLAAELRRQFVQDFGTTHCATLREGFDRERQHEECRNLVHAVAGSLLKLLTLKQERTTALSDGR